MLMPSRAGLPARRADAERREQPRLQVVGFLLAGGLLHDGRQDVAGRRVVEEDRARLVQHGMIEERLRPAACCRGTTARCGGRWTSPAGRGSASPFWKSLPAAGVMSGKYFEHRIVDAQLALGLRQADRRRREALGQREHLVRRVGGERRPPAFRDHLAVPDDDDAVHRVDAGVERLDEGEQGLRRHALRFRRGPRQLVRDRRQRRDAGAGRLAPRRARQRR